MGIWQAPQVSAELTPEQHLNLFASVLKDLDYILNGYIDSKNVREIAGFAVSLTELLHKSGLVGMSAADPTNPDAVRFWAGDEDKENAPFRVLQKGLMIAVGALLMSASGFPRVEMNNENLIKAMADEDNYLSINPTIGGSPALAFFVDGLLDAYLTSTSSGSIFRSFNSGITLQSATTVDLAPSGALKINGTSGISGNFSYVNGISSDGMGNYYATYGLMTFTKGILTAIS